MIVVMGKRLIWQNVGTAYIDTYQSAPLFYFLSADGEPEFKPMANSYNDIS